MRKKYEVAKTRQLVYLLYDHAENQPVSFIADKKGIFILYQIVSGKKYEEIAAMLGCSSKNVEKHLDKMCGANNCQDNDELIIRYTDWKKRNE